MTERALPPVSVGSRRDRPTDAIRQPAVVPALDDASRRAPAGARVGGARVTARRHEAILSTPARAGMLLGATAAVYAVSVAGIAALQADTDARTMAARAPYLDEVARLQAANDELERRLGRFDAEARALAADYGAVGVTVSDYEARLDALAALVADVEGSVAALPTRIKLPNVTMRGAIGGTSRSSGGRSAPSTSGTSGASGG